MNTLREVFDYYHVKPKDQLTIARILSEEGYTVRGICYAASKSEEKLSRFVADSRFVSVFINEVHKLALKPGDPRWKTRKENNKC